MPNQLTCPHCFAPFTEGLLHCPSCGIGVENQNPYGALPYGALLAERYIVGAFLYADGEGLAYEAVERATAAPVRIKEYLPITLAEDRAPDGTVGAKQGSGVMFKTTRMDFADLYLALCDITPAPGLHQVLDVVEANNTVYAVLAPLQGVPLSQYLRAVPEGKLTPNAARQLLARVFEGVQVLHAVSLVHRGISPENIIVQPDGSTCLTGYATIGLRTIGTALRPQLYEGYSAPEQYATAEFEGRYTDVYCLAAVYYYLVTGQAPISAGQRLVVDANPSARSLAQSVSRCHSDLLAIALAMHPAERMQTVGKLAECLASPEAAQELVFAAKRKKKRKARPALTGNVGIVVIICSVLVCCAAWFMISYRTDVEVQEPEPTPTATPEPTAVPVLVDNFVGLLYSQLISTSAYNDKYLFYVAEERYSDEVAGTIIAQTPAAGQALGDSITVELVVSKGPEMVVVPQVFGFTQESASEEITAAGLTASFVMQVNDGSYASGCVIKTDPEAGSEVQAGTTITVYIAADRGVVVNSGGD